MFQLSKSSEEFPASRGNNYPRCTGVQSYKVSTKYKDLAVEHTPGIEGHLGSIPPNKKFMYFMFFKLKLCQQCSMLKDLNYIYSHQVFIVTKK